MRVRFREDPERCTLRIIPSPVRIAVAPKGILWTNKSVLKFAGDRDPITLIESKARELVLRRAT